jgi:hypothetical protein
MTIAMLTKSIFYTLGLALILMHEMDAVRCKEWRIFPGLSLLSDARGFVVFMLAHIPLFFWLLAMYQRGSQSFRMGFDVFLIVHLGLHILFLRHPNNLFKDWISWSIIVGAGICGLIDLLINRF